MFKEYVFKDGYVCWVKGFSKQELRVEIRKHGKLMTINGRAV